MLIAAPLLWPLFMVGLLLAIGRRESLRRWISVAGAAVHLSLAGALIPVTMGGPMSLAVGGWRAPFGIVLAVDRLSAAMVVIAALVGLVVAIYSVSGIDHKRERYGYHPLVHALLAGVTGAFLTADFFNLYVWFELMLMASFVLMALGGEKRQLQAALRYFALNLLASMVFLVALGLMYGLTGSLNMAAVSDGLAASSRPDLALVVWGLLLLAFGIKAAVFPLYSWLPTTYPTPPTVVSALFAGLLTKVGVYALMRTCALMPPAVQVQLLPVVMGIGALTMVFGVLGAVGQKTFRGVLSFHIISQIGYMVIGIGMGTAAGLFAAIFYTLHHILVKTNLFLVAGVARRWCGTEELKGMGGLYRSNPWLTLLFAVSALSLAGLPPLSGFWAKLLLIQGLVGAGELWMAGLAAAVGALTLFSMLKLWNEAFWKPGPSASVETMHAPIARYAGMALLAAGTVAIGLAPSWLAGYARDAAEELVRPEVYKRVVGGGDGRQALAPLAPGRLRSETIASGWGDRANGWPPLLQAPHQVRGEWAGCVPVGRVTPTVGLWGESEKDQNHKAPSPSPSHPTKDRRSA